MTRSVVIVGGGPRGDRCARTPRGERARVRSEDLDVHLVDPYPDGAGRIWREDQSALLWMNSMAADVTMFTDDSVRCEGPIVPGPSLYEWAVAVRDGELDGESVPDGPVGDELRALGPATFATRRLQSHYLDFVLRRVLADPARRRSACTATAPGRSGCAAAPRTCVLLDGGGELPADVLVLASGHLDAAPTEAEADARGARRRARPALLPARADHRLRPRPHPGGGDGDRARHGPRVRRPHGAALRGPRRPLPRPRRRHARLRALRPRARACTSGPDAGCRTTPRPSTRCADRARRCRGSSARTRSPAFVRRGSVDLRRDVWPLMAKEVGWGYYHELFAGHPDRVRGTWDDFAAALRRARLVLRRPAASSSPGSCPTPTTASTSSASTAPARRRRAATSPSLQERLRAYIARRPRAATSTTATPPSSGRSSACCRCSRRSRSSRARRPDARARARRTCRGGRTCSARWRAARPARGCASCSRSRAPGYVVVPRRGRRR